MQKLAYYWHRQAQRPLLSLVIILMAFFLLGGVYIWRVPPFEGPDEGQHFAYVVWLAQGKGLPPQGEAAWQTPIEQEAGQPPLYYFITSLPARLVELDNPTAVYRPNPYFAAPLDRTRFDNDNRAIHYPQDRQVLRGGWIAFYAARFLSLCFGLLLVASTYGVARQITPEQPGLALGAALVVATTPQILHIATVVSNDVPAAALSTLALWLWLVWLRQPPARGAAWAFWPGLVLGLAALAKISALAVGAAFAGGLLWLGVSSRRSWRQVFAAGLWLGLGVLLATGWWLGRGWLLDGAPGGLAPHYGAPWVITDAAAQLPAMGTRWLEVGRSFWLALGWGTVRPAGWTYVIYAIWVLLGLGGAALFLARREAAATRVQLGLLGLAVVATAVALEFWMRQVTAPHGRLLYPALAPIAFTLALGWRTLLRRWQLLPYLFSGAWALLAPITLVQAAFYPPPLLTAAALPATTLGWTFAPQAESPLAELLTLTPGVETLTAGEVLPVHLCWRALRTATRDYTLFLHLVGPENSVIGGRRTYPGQGLRPTSIWQPGQAWCDVAHLYVPPQVAQTLVYHLEMGLLDEQTGERLAAYDRQGAPLTQTNVAQVKVVATTAVSLLPTPSPPIPNSTDPWQLTSFATDRTWQPGTAVPLTLQWRVMAPIGQDYQTFVHLRQPGSTDIVAQADGPPLDGWYPTSWWAPGEIITDPRLFPLPQDMSPGRYQLVVGFYDLATTQAAGTAVDLGTIQVQP